MFNPILCPTRNNLHLLRRAVQTFRQQDVGDLEIFIINNGSTDGTGHWLRAQPDVVSTTPDPPASVAESWNSGLRVAFGAGARYALVVNNDVELRPDTYRHLLNNGGGFVTAVGVREPEKILELNEPNPEKIRNHPDFSCFLIRKEVYDEVGPFDEDFKLAFGEDWDYHVRLHKAGITAISLDLPFLHHGSMTVKNADASEARKIQMQAEKNRMHFKEKWGFVGASKEYYDFFGNQSPEG